MQISVHFHILTLCILDGQADIDDFILNRVSLEQHILFLFIHVRKH